MSGRARIGAVAALLLVLSVALGYSWREHQRAERAEQQLGLDAARVLSTSFAATNQLKVSELTGEVVAQAEGASAFGMIRATQQTRAPFSAAYFVDLSRLDPAAMRWNAEARTLYVEVPDVIVAAPAIDLTRATTRQGGLYISRAAGLTMQRQVATRLATRAGAEARSPANVLKARAAARDAVSRTLAAPLAAAGLGNVSVQVRLAGDPRPGGRDEHWDVSRSISEVLQDVAE